MFKAFKKREAIGFLCVSVLERNTYTLPFMYALRHVELDENVGPISRQNSSLFSVWPGFLPKTETERKMFIPNKY